MQMNADIYPSAFILKYQVSETIVGEVVAPLKAEATVFHRRQEAESPDHLRRLAGGRRPGRASDCRRYLAEWLAEQTPIDP